MSKWRSLIFPLALGLILSGLSAWLDRVSEVIIEEVKLNPDEPQYLMRQIEGKRYDASGSLKEHLFAPKAWQLPDQNHVFFNAPEFHLFHEQKVQYSVKSQHARYEMANKMIFFDQNVELFKAEEASSPAAHVHTDFLNVDTQNEIAHTSAPVMYRYGRSNGSAQGMIYDHKTGQLNLPSKVKALIYEEK